MPMSLGLGLGIPHGGGNPWSAYAAGGFIPAVVADFVQGRYKNGGGSSFDGLLTHAASGNATMVDSDGLLKWRPHNLALNSATPATQAVTVVSGADYTVECTGVSIALSGAGTGTVTEGNPVMITASTTTLTLTVTGSTGTMWAYRSDLGGMVDNPDRGDSYVPTTSTAVYMPRRGHHKYNGSAWVNKGLLLESEARTNLEPDSDDMSGWAATNVTATKNQTGAGGVANSAHLLTAGAANGTITNTITAASNDFVFSALVKRVTGTGTIEMTMDGGTTWVDVTSDINSSEFIQVGTGAGANTTNPQYGFRIVTSGDEIAVQINQLEQTSGQFSSPIPTSGSTATRAAETLAITAGDFAGAASDLGSELVTNGGFDTDTTWIKATGWTISGGECHAAGVAAFSTVREDSFPFVEGAVYLVEYTVTDFTSGSVRVRFEGGSAVSGAYRTAAGTYQEFMTAVSGNNSLRVQAGGSGLTASIDNISVKEVSMPAAVSIAVAGEVSFADEGAAAQEVFANWATDASNYISLDMDTDGAATGEVNFNQAESGTADTVASATGAYTPGLNVPFSIASRHGATFINGAHEGTVLTENSTPTALADLSATDLDIGPTFMGTLSQFLLWSDDIGDTGIGEATS